MYKYTCLHACILGQSATKFPWLFIGASLICHISFVFVNIKKKACEIVVIVLKTGLSYHWMFDSAMPGS